jgi:proteasome lid subunit RPN8/RPN11
MQLPQRVWSEVVAHLAAELPREGVGILVESRGSIRFIKLQNTAQDETHFRVSPQEWVSLFHEIEAANEKLIAVVHSHPDAFAIPSQVDIDNFFFPDARMLIVSFRSPGNPEGHLYMKEGQHFRRCPLEII